MLGGDWHAVMEHELAKLHQLPNASAYFENHGGSLHSKEKARAELTALVLLDGAKNLKDRVDENLD